jgi:hypothetical protein
MQGDLVAFGTWTGTYHLFTRDGLYVANLFKDQRLGVFDEEYLCWETYGGALMKEPTGTYLLSGGGTDARITRIHGLETLVLISGILSITEQDVERATDADRDYRTRLARAQTLFIARGKKSLQEIRLRGVIPAIGLERTIDGKRGFTVHAARDNENLYLLMQVSTSSEFVAAADTAFDLLGAGNVIDVQLATDPRANPRRSVPVSGDVRVLLSQSAEGKVLALLQRTNEKGGAVFEDVGERIAASCRQRREGGFTSLVTMPLETLGWKPRPAHEVRMDIGYWFGNADGSACEARAYWYNGSLAAKETHDRELKARLEPARWGTAVLE